MCVWCGDGGGLIFLSTFPVQIHTMSSVSKEQITEAWTRLTEKNEKKNDDTDQK